MTDRITPHCSADHWRECLVAMNEQKEIVTLSMAAVNDVIRCHQNHGGSISNDLIVHEGRTKTKVRRNLLWDLVQAHGELACDKPVKGELQ